MRLTAVLASAVLAFPPAFAGAPPSAASVSATPASVPCPMTKPSPPVTRPPKPSPPAHQPSTVGGSDLATAGLTVPGGASPIPGKLTATSWVVADLDTGEVLGACGPHEYSPPASVQKLLVAATFMAKLDPKQVVTVTRGDLNIEPGSSAVGLLPGGKYPVSTLWLGLLLQSGNDAANVLARLGGGVAAMNAEARRLGAYETHAVTPSGLDGRGQFTSAYDLALIAREDFARPDFRKYVTTQRTQIPAQPSLHKGGFQIQNENRLLYEYPGALGGKTGFTDQARHTYVGAAQRNGRRLVVTLLGAEARPLRGWQQGAALLDWGFSVPPGASVGHLVTSSELSPTPSAAPLKRETRAEPDRAVSATTVPGWVMPAVAVSVLALVALVALRRFRQRKRHPERGVPR